MVLNCKIIEENGENIVSVEKEKTISSQAKLFFQLVVCQTLKVLERLSLNDRGVESRSTNTWKSVPGIYAPGDISKVLMLAHAAFRMGEVSAQKMLKGEIMVAKLKI